MLPISDNISVMPEKYTKTKIIVTLGPATASVEMLEKLIRERVDICRLNMAHADHDWTREIVGNINEACERAGRRVATLMDVKGPEIRTGDLPEKYELQEGEMLDITYGEGIGSCNAEGIRRVDVNYPQFAEDVSVGDTVLVDSGLIRMEVLEIDGKRVRCKVLIPGPMGNRRHINLPGVRVQLPALTEKDQADIDCGVEVGIDFFALSFVREAEDLHTLRRYLEERGSEARIIAKIEDQQAIRNLDSIVEASNGLMVARGDLGIECPFEDLPIIQSRAIDSCIRQSKPVIVATHMLESMISSPIPTRAEVTDVSNAIWEKADCVMLSGETTVGKYPLECVRTLKRIAGRIEPECPEALRADLELDHPRAKMLRSAAYLAAEMSVALVVFTRRGFFAQKLSSLRPKVPVYAFTDNPALVRQLLIMRSVEPFFIEFDSEDFERTIQNSFNALKKGTWAKSGDQVVVITKMRAGGELWDTTQMRVV